MVLFSGESAGSPLRGLSWRWRIQPVTMKCLHRAWKSGLCAQPSRGRAGPAVRQHQETTKP